MYTFLQTMVRVHLLQVSLNPALIPGDGAIFDGATWWLASCGASRYRRFISDSTILLFRHFIDQYGLAQISSQPASRCLAAEAELVLLKWFAADGTFYLEAPSSTKNKAHAEILRWLQARRPTPGISGWKENKLLCVMNRDHLRQLGRHRLEHDITHLGDLLKGFLEKDGLP